MPPLTALERFFERLFERPSARLFRARVQPIQLQRRIERAMEAERLTTSDRTLAPNRFVVHLNPADLLIFGDMTGSLASELADGALSFARAHRYTVVDRPRVDLLADPATPSIGQQYAELEQQGKTIAVRSTVGSASRSTRGRSTTV